ncbi:alpha-hydroxy acid oxidase [Chelatococcus sp. GCM10030263]|uniref:alpha-hydroxy acid oxidase n=1 Tax=Chelatococcus sp. GCM10030263 TaxID=3273387 RepID=UPI00360D2FFB
MKIDKALTVEDLRKAAKRRLPRIAFDFIEGGVDSEHGIARNERIFSQCRLLPRYFVDVSKRSQKTTIFGKTYDSPFGFSPTGTPDLWRPGAEGLLAQTAGELNIPFLLSTAGNNTVEKAARLARGNLWFQLYTTRDRAIADSLIGRAKDAGVETLVVTADVPVAPNRERNMRNGFSRPLRKTLSLVLDGMRHPSWTWNYLRTGGMPLMGSFAAYAPPSATPDEVADFFGTQLPTPDQTWRDFEHLRKMWPGHLVIKGILHPEDARRAAEIGANGIYVSNHGGRQLDGAPSPLEVLPAIREAVPGQTIVMDSGFRRGSDIIIAMALGVDVVLLGRAPLYGVSAFGREGARKLVSILRREIDLNLAQIGCPDINALDESFVVPPPTIRFGNGRPTFQS